MEHYYIIFERPYLQEFLDYIFETFNVTIWSAASKDYVLFIVDKIILKDKPERKIQNIFFSYHCNKSKSLYNGAIKKLKMLWEYCKLKNYNKNNTFIIDDLKKVKMIQPYNCYNIKEFEFLHEKSEKDKQLLLLMDFLNDLLDKIRENSPKTSKHLINQ